MAETIYVDIPTMRGVTSLKAFVYDDDTNVLLNTGGDDLTESSGRFSFTLAETRDGHYRVEVGTSSSLIDYWGYLHSSEVIVRDIPTWEILNYLPQIGGTYRHTQVAANSGAKTADVTISVTP